MASEAGFSTVSLARLADLRRNAVRFMPLRSLFISVVLGWVWIVPNRGCANWTKTIDCPSGRVYRDVRRDAGREEFCELLLPGSLQVRDGPSRWSSNHEQNKEEGSYQQERKVGR